jgi:hypothetical protein
MDRDIEMEERINNLKIKEMDLKEREMSIIERKELLKELEIKNKLSEENLIRQRADRFINGSTWKPQFRNYADFGAIEHLSKIFNKSIYAISSSMYVNENGEIGFLASFYISIFNTLPDWEHELRWEEEFEPAYRVRAYCTRLGKVITTIDGSTEKKIQNVSKKYYSQWIDREWASKQPFYEHSIQWHTNFRQKAMYKSASMFFKTHAPEALHGNNIVEDMIFEANAKKDSAIENHSVSKRNTKNTENIEDTSGLASTMRDFSAKKEKEMNSEANQNIRGDIEVNKEKDIIDIELT